MNRTTRSIYQFSVEYQDLSLEYLRRIIRLKVDDAINDADKANAEYKYYDIHHVRILSNMKKPIKENPFLDSFSDTALRSLCSNSQCFGLIRSHHSTEEEIASDSVGHLDVLCSVGQATEWNDRRVPSEDRLDC